MLSYQPCLIIHNDLIVNGAFGFESMRDRSSPFLNCLELNFKFLMPTNVSIEFAFKTVIFVASGNTSIQLNDNNCVLAFGSLVGSLQIKL